MDVRIVIRPGERRDLPVLGRLGALLVRVHHAFDRARFMEPGAHVEEGYAAFLCERLDDPDSIVYVARREERVVGYVYAGMEPRSWKELRDRAGFLHDVVVEPDARRHGIARRLVEVAADWLESAGAPRLMLWTAERNKAAQVLFEQLGFRRTMIEMTRERRTRERA